MWWFLAREVLRLRGSISRELQWDVMPDLFFYRDPEEAEKEEQQRQETLAQAAQAAQAAAQPPKPDDDWGEQVTDWANEPAPGMGAGAPGAVAPAAANVPKFQVCKRYWYQENRRKVIRKPCYVSNLGPCPQNIYNFYL